MESVSIQSDNLKVEISLKGAEVTSVIDKASRTEFMWNANPQIWNRHAPILFPIVGKLNQNTLHCKGKNYTMGQHGFARDKTFEVLEIYTDLVRFMLVSDDVSLANFPYQFKLFITYAVKENYLEISYEVYNTDTEKMYFSIGAHPGFLLPEKDFNSFEIQFESKENLETHLLKEGLFSGEKALLHENTNRLLLNENTFQKDALVFKHLNSKFICLKHLNSEWEIKLDFEGFPYLGVWTKHPYQDFICLEPWQGLADKIDFNGDLSKKEGIVELEPQEMKQFKHILSFKPAI
jgi:galactose mutarotase-like enzyme